MTKQGIFAHGVDFFYENKKVLHDIRIDFSAGKFYGILGANGCGKSTLLDILSGYKSPSKGEVLVDGRILSSYIKKEQAKKIALSPQEFSFNLGFSVEEIVLMGRHPHIPRFSLPSSQDKKIVDEILEEFDLASLRHRNANDLSGGQKQRLLVARTLAQDTPYILLDEVTANLDIKYSLQIYSLMKQLVQEKAQTVIAVVHDLNLAAAYCDEIVFMKDGCVHCAGSCAEVMNAENIEAVFGVQARVGRDLYQQEYQTSLYYE